jgi:hypothetical protein
MEVCILLKIFKNFYINYLLCIVFFRNFALSMREKGYRSEQEGLSPAERSRFADSEKPFHSKTVRATTKGATIGTLDERTN